MVIYKCKMCGGNLEIREGSSVATCEYCGSVQTIPSANDEVIINLYNRANALRLRSEFDKAAETYENILNMDNTQSEAHWGLVLCKYGVEYVEDACFGDRVPTCHRTQMESILTDLDYLSAIQYAAEDAKKIYQREAQKINEIQKGILEIVKKEEPFDIFICYKEKDENKERTRDSVIANDVYHELTTAGYKVFYAAITLEDKLGTEYEPYIYAALSTSKIMLVLGTKQEYFNAPWVKNEWSRYLHMMKNNKDRKRMLIPCFKDMDAYDLPVEFSHLQALDMSGIAFMADLTRNIGKIIGKEEKKQTPRPQNEDNLTPLLKRAFLFLEDGDFQSANSTLEKALDMDPENSSAYIGKLMISLKLTKKSELCCVKNISDYPEYQKAFRYAVDSEKEIISGYREGEYQEALTLLSNKEYDDAIHTFNKISDYRDSSSQISKAEFNKNLDAYNTAIKYMDYKKYSEAIRILINLGDFQDSHDLLKRCKLLKSEFDAAKNEDRCSTIYGKAVNSIKSKDYSTALSLLSSIKGYRDADKLYAECKEAKEKNDEAYRLDTYNTANQLARHGRYDEAADKFASILGYRNSNELWNRAKTEAARQPEVKRKRKKAIIISIIIAIIVIGCIVGAVCIVNAIHAAENAPGTANNPIQISTAEDLKNIQNKLDGHYVLVNDIYLEGKWTPIGYTDDESYSLNSLNVLSIHAKYEDYSFKGSFDGNGHTIYNLRVQAVNNEHYVGGLFNAICDGGEVKNLNLVNPRISSRIGGTIAGYVADSTITNCHVSGAIMGVDDDDSTIRRYGGIVYCLWNRSGEEDKPTAISSCSFDGEIKKCYNAGGIVNELYGTVPIKDCKSSGKITAKESAAGIYCDIHYEKPPISNCTSTMELIPLTKKTETYTIGKD